MDYYRVSQAAALLKVSASSMRRYVELGLVECTRNPSGHRVFTLAELERFNGGPLFTEDNAQVQPSTVFYVRASDGDATRLESQEAALTKAYGEPSRIYKDRASGLNEKRPGLQSLLKAARKGSFKRVAITQEDRLTRFGFTYLEGLLEAYGVEVVTLGKKEQVSIQEELVADFMSLLASFSGRYYRLRGYSQQKEFLSKMETKLEEKE